MSRGLVELFISRFGMSEIERKKERNKDRNFHLLKALVKHSFTSALKNKNEMNAVYVNTTKSHVIVI